MSRVGMVLAFFALAGCHYYRVPDAEIARMMSVPKKERRTLVLAAQRDTGQPVGLRGRTFRVLGPAGEGTQRVRVADPLLPAGIVLLTIGIALTGPGIGLLTQLGCDRNSCGDHGGAVAGGVGGGLTGAGAAHLIPGLILTIVGAGHRLEVR